MMNEETVRVVHIPVAGHYHVCGNEYRLIQADDALAQTPDTDRVAAALAELDDLIEDRWRCDPHYSMTDQTIKTIKAALSQPQANLDDATNTTIKELSAFYDIPDRAVIKRGVAMLQLIQQGHATFVNNLDQPQAKHIDTECPRCSKEFRHIVDPQAPVVVPPPVQAERVEQVQVDLGRFESLSEEAQETLIGMVEHCINCGLRMGMDEGYDKNDEHHPFVKELIKFCNTPITLATGRIKTSGRSLEELTTQAADKENTK